MRDPLMILALCATLPGTASALETTIELRYDGHYYADDATEFPSVRQGGYLGFEFSRRSDSLAFKGRASVRSNPEAEPREYDDRLYIEELKVDYVIKDFDITLGRQHIRTGRATLVNPTDAFDQRDYRDALLAADRSRAMDGVKITYHGESFDIDAAYAPAATPSLMPHVRSRWFFRLPDREDVGGGIVLPIDYVWADYAGDRAPGDRSQYLLKLNRDADALSYSISYFSGTDNLPGFESGAPIPTADGLRVPIRQIYPEKRALGFDTEILLGKLVLRAEAARVDLDFAGGRRDSYDHAVIGFDLNVESGLFGKSTYVAIEYSKQWSRDGLRYGKEDLRHIFSDALLARLELEPTSRDAVSANLIYDTRNRQSAALFEWKREVNERLSVSASLDFLSGRPETFFGQYTGNDRLGVGLEYVF
ncbi:MAG: hypothetical protein ACOY82_03340 [Pseudomonadota bacterium]